MAKIQSTLKLIPISTGNSDATKKDVGAIHRTIVQRACFWLLKVSLATVKPMLSPDKPMELFFSCRTCQKGPTASSSY